MTRRHGILFAAPGTTCPAAMAGYETIGRAAALRFPEMEQRWVYTSAGIRRKLAEHGAPVKGPIETLDALRAEGFTRLAVLSLHLTDGMEYGELAEAVSDLDNLPGKPLHAVLGRPLLTCEPEWKRVLAALAAEFPSSAGAPESIILVGHGSRDPRAEKTLLEAARLCRMFDSRFILGMMLGEPGLADVVRECRQAGVKNAWLLPCMVVAGFSAREDIAGTGEGSWATALARAGIGTTPVIRGLGEIEGVVAVWMDTLGRLLAESEQDPRKKE